MDEKQEKRIVYQGGVTRRTSDFLCQDGELAECINITADGEELKVIPELETKMTGLNGTLLYVHRYNDQERYIVLVPGSPNVVRWGTMASGNTYQQATVYVPQEQIGDIIIGAHNEPAELFETTGDVKVTSIGKILIFTTVEGLKYAMWKADSYDVYDKIPEPQVEFALSKQSSSGQVSMFTDDSSITWETYIEASGNVNGILNVGIGTATIVDQEKYNDLILGLYSKNKKNISERKAFCLPFFIRTALEMYDGSYTYVSQPILMLPAVTRNAYYTFNSNDELKFRTALSYLYYRSKYDYSEWNDIIKGVTVFISAPIEINNIWSDLPNPEVIPYVSAQIEIDRIVGNNYQCVFESEKANNVTYDFYAFRKREDLEMKNEITSASIFYKLATIGAVGTGFTGTHNGWEQMAGLFETRTLGNLTSQEQLKQDDYYSHCSIQALLTYAYNSRLNLANIKRGFYEGFRFFLPYDNNYEYEYTALVRIKTDSGERIVKRTWNSQQKQGIWFYYPDPRAEWVTIWRRMNGLQVCALDAKLTEHPGLNGAYYFRGLPTADYQENDTPSENAIPYNTTPSVDPELFPNQLATSEVNNPFVFNASGYNTVGTGRILALSTQTQALSQGQFGQYPLLVFCDDGIWAMAVDATGLYQSIHPMPREVCINAGAIVQTDDAVLFVSKKGLMVINGREVTCVSTAMDGLPFNTQSNNVSCLNYENLDDQSQESAPWADIIDLAADATTFQTFLSSGVLHMAYDYIDARVMLFNSTYGYSWVCSMKDGGFTKQLLKKKILNVVNDYPDYLLQDGYGNLYTLYGKTREESVSTRRLGFLVTRPLKLSAPLTVSSVRELVNVGYWDNRDNGSVVRTLLIVSDNLLTWFPASSRFGAAAKYYRIALFVKMLPSERLSGTIIRLQDRRTNNLRK